MSKRAADIDEGPDSKKARMLQTVANAVPSFKELAKAQLPTRLLQAAQGEGVLENVGEHNYSARLFDEVPAFRNTRPSFLNRHVQHYFAPVLDNNLGG